MVGPVVGAIVLVFLPEQVREISPQAHLLLCALMVIVVMKFFRQGLYGLLASALTKRGWLSASTPLTTE